MVRPFDLEEILPDVAVGPVRLPRHQAGVAPQGLAMTMLADYTLRTRAWLPSAAIVALLAESDVTPGAARTAVSRLARRGVLDSARQGRHTFYRLSEPAAAALAVGGRSVVGFPARAESWDGNWTLVAFSLPNAADTARRAVRGRLRWLGYAPLYDGLWVSPHGAPERVAAALADCAGGSASGSALGGASGGASGGAVGGAMTVFRARSLRVTGEAGRDPLQAWDVAAVGEHYGSFVRHWDPLLPRVRAGEVGGAEALRARTGVMDAYRRFVALDPRLPMRLMPDGWPRERARDLFSAIYDGLAAPALRHVLATVARFEPHPAGSRPEPSSAIVTHTVDDLFAGVLATVTS